MKKLVYILLLALAVTSCRLEVKPYVGTTVLPEEGKEHLDSIRFSIVMKGDTAGLAQLHKYYVGRSCEIDVLPYYVVLADKYKMPSACADIYQIAQRNKQHKGIDRLGLKYLTRGVALGDKKCVEIQQGLKNDSTTIEKTKK